MEKKIATDTPLYRHDAAYAREHDELPLYRESYQANIACKEAIEEAISENYGNNRLNSQAVFDAVSAEFSMERIQYVLANTVQYKDWDGRISRANREWAQTVPVVPNPDSWGGDRNCYFVVDRPHTGLTDLFITHFRKELEKAPREKKPSVLEKLQKPLPDAEPQPDGIQFRTVDDLGRICLPKDIRDKLGIKPGTECAVYATDELTSDEIIVIRRK